MRLQVPGDQLEREWIQQQVQGNEGLGHAGDLLRNDPCCRRLRSFLLRCILMLKGVKLPGEKYIAHCSPISREERLQRLFKLLFQ